MAAATKTSVHDAPGRPEIVLDSNAVYDWLVYGDPSSAAWAAALTAGRVRWIATAAMREELFHTLPRLATTRWAIDAPAVAGVWARCAFEVATPVPASPAERLTCTDPDDQKFIDLALARRARWLLTHDRALLRLARRARSHGVLIQTPADWREHCAP